MPSSILLISIDTLRADRLGCHGTPRPTTPAIDAFARQGVLFSNVITEASWTLPSHMTLMTGLHPTSHGVTVVEKSLPGSIPTLAEVLRDHGYRTHAYTDGGLVGGQFGFARGFEVYDERQKEFRLTLHRARQFLESLTAEEPFFLFVHTYAVHCPYDPRDEYAKIFRTRPAADHLETAGKCGNPDFNRMKLSPGQVAFLSDQYDAGVREADDELRKFFQFLRERDILERTVVVLFSDHGEELHEHGQIGHERALFVELLQVPLVFVAPAMSPTLRSDRAGLADVFPTVLDLAGIEAPASQGRSLFDEGRPRSHEAPAFSELDRDRRLRSVIAGDRHLIQDLDRRVNELYDLRADPLETKDLARKGSPTQDLLELLTEHSKRLPRPNEIPSRRLSEEKLRELRALGYVD
jgi:arylsulfatase A-like enzyme